MIMNDIIKAQLALAGDLGAAYYYCVCDGRGNCPSLTVADVISRFTEYDPVDGDASPASLADAFVASYREVCAENID